MSYKNSIFVVVRYILLITVAYDCFIAPVHAKSKVHIVYLGEKQHNDPEVITQSHHDMLTSVVGSKEAAADLIVYNYKHGFSGFAAKLTDSQAERVAELPGVVHVTGNQFHSLQTTRSWDYLDLSYYSSKNLLHDTNQGDGIIIGFLDSGVWPESKMFDDEGLGPIPRRWKGNCESGQLFDAQKHCNRKLIGAKYFIDGFLAENEQPFNTTDNPDYMSPRDVNGHGTHVSTTAAGSFVANTSYKGLALGTVRGGAPKARIAMYKVAWGPVGQCSSADLLKAFDEAIHDGVDVISVSIGNNFPLFPEVGSEHSGIAVGSFHAVASGIPVVCAAGNDGPSAQRVDNTSPWIITVAATTLDRSFATAMTLGNNITIMGQAKFTGKEIGFTGLMYPEAPGLLPTIPGICDILSPNDTSVKGKVVLCFTSANGVPDFEAVRKAGGVGVIFVRNPNNDIVPCGNNFPCVDVDNDLGSDILSYIRSTRFPLVKISPSRTLVGKPVSTKVAYFSSRGPNSLSPAILKPDIAAPGVGILAASSPSDPFSHDGFALMSGTSMATPIVSGVVALLKVQHPDWSPAAIKSAIVTTAWKTDPFGEPIFAEGETRKLADPFDYGGGLVNPNKAAAPGLVYDMGVADYIHYLCAAGYNQSSISLLGRQATGCPTTKPSVLNVNLPSITIPNLTNSVTITRTVTNVGPIDSVYRLVIEHPLGIVVSVNPDTLVFNSTIRTNSFMVLVSTNHKVNTGYYFGSITWTDGKHNVISPISVRTQIIEFYTDSN